MSKYLFILGLAFVLALFAFSAKTATAQTTCTALHGEHTMACGPMAANEQFFGDGCCCEDLYVKSGNACVDPLSAFLNSLFGFGSYASCTSHAQCPNTCEGDKIKSGYCSSGQCTYTSASSCASGMVCRNGVCVSSGGTTTCTGKCMSQQCYYYSSCSSGSGTCASGACCTGACTSSSTSCTVSSCTATCPSSCSSCPCPSGCQKTSASGSSTCGGSSGGTSCSLTSCTSTCSLSCGSGCSCPSGCQKTSANKGETCGGVAGASKTCSATSTTAGKVTVTSSSSMASVYVIGDSKTKYCGSGTSMSCDCIELGSNSYAKCNFDSAGTEVYRAPFTCQGSGSTPKTCSVSVSGNTITVRSTEFMSSVYLIGDSATKACPFTLFSPTSTGAICDCTGIGSNSYAKCNWADGSTDRKSFTCGGNTPSQKCTLTTSSTKTTGTVGTTDNVRITATATGCSGCYLSPNGNPGTIITFSSKSPSDGMIGSDSITVSAEYSCIGAGIGTLKIVARSCTDGDLEQTTSTPITCNENTPCKYSDWVKQDCDKKISGCQCSSTEMCYRSEKTSSSTSSCSQYQYKCVEDSICKDTTVTCPGSDGGGWCYSAGCISERKVPDKTCAEGATCCCPNTWKWDDIQKTCVGTGSGCTDTACCVSSLGSCYKYDAASNKCVADDGKKCTKDSKEGTCKAGVCEVSTSDYQCCADAQMCQFTATDGSTVSCGCGQYFNPSGNKNSGSCFASSFCDCNIKDNSKICKDLNKVDCDAKKTECKWEGTEKDGKCLPTSCSGCFYIRYRDSSGIEKIGDFTCGQTINSTHYCYCAADRCESRESGGAPKCTSGCDNGKVKCGACTSTSTSGQRCVCGDKCELKTPQSGDASCSDYPSCPTTCEQVKDAGKNSLVGYSKVESATVCSSLCGGSGNVKDFIWAPTCSASGNKDFGCCKCVGDVQVPADRCLIDGKIYPDKTVTCDTTKNRVVQCDISKTDKIVVLDTCTKDEKCINNACVLVSTKACTDYTTKETCPGWCSWDETNKKCITKVEEKKCDWKKSTNKEGCYIDGDLVKEGCDLYEGTNSVDCEASCRASEGYIQYIRGICLVKTDSAAPSYGFGVVDIGERATEKSTVKAGGQEITVLPQNYACLVKTTTGYRIVVQTYPCEQDIEPTGLVIDKITTECGTKCADTCKSYEDTTKQVVQYYCENEKCRCMIEPKLLISDGGTTTKPQDMSCTGQGGRCTFTACDAASGESAVTGATGCPVASKCCAKVCKGNLALALSENKITAGDEVSFTISGLNNCDGRTVQLSYNNVLYGSCAVSGSGCSGKIEKAIAVADTYEFVAVVDKNNNGAATDIGEITKTTLTVESKPKGLFGFFWSIFHRIFG